MARENYKKEIYNMALAKMNKVVLLTGDVKMHFAQKKLMGDAGLIQENNLNWIENELKADY